jgi:hypothetical protein
LGWERDREGVESFSFLKVWHRLLFLHLHGCGVSLDDQAQVEFPVLIPTARLFEIRVVGSLMS